LAAKVVYDKLSEVGACAADAPEPWMIKSKVATLMAEVVRQEGAKMVGVAHFIRVKTPLDDSQYSPHVTNLTHPGVTT
jgi:hypothetical protein